MTERENTAADGPDQEDEEVRRGQEERLRKVWAAPKGWRYWSAVNNTEVGIWYTAAAFGFMLFAGVLALTMRVQLAVPENDFLTATFYNQASSRESYSSSQKRLMFSPCHWVDGFGSFPQRRCAR